MCCLLPKLYSIYAKTLTEKALEKTRRIIIGGERIKTIKYMNDQAVLAESGKGLQIMLGEYCTSGDRIWNKINVGKTRSM